MIHPTFAPRRWIVRLPDAGLCGIAEDALRFRFLSPLEFEETADQGVYRLTSALRWFDPVAGLQATPEGFLTDFYSAPRWAAWIAPQNEPASNAAAVVHDYCVRNRKRLGLGLTQCHAIFLRAMLCLGVPRWKARARWLAVWLFNWVVAGDGVTYVALWEGVAA